MLQRLGLKEGEAIIHPWVNKALAKAQQKVEARNYDIRKQLLKFDDVMNDQRKVVYEQRREIMTSDEVAITIADMRNETIDEIGATAIPENALPEQWDMAGLHAECLRLLALDLPLAEWAEEDGIDADEVRERIMAAADRKMAEKTANAGPELMRMAEKSLLLHLRQGINLRAYAQRDPLNEYKREAFELFQGMLANLRQHVTSVLSHIELRVPQPQPAFAEVFAEPEAALAEEMPATGTTGRPLPRGRRTGSRGNGVDIDGPRFAAARNAWSGTPRNAPCPCGSGRKFKHCHGRI
jgi:preprotein translocase subunit SecA